MTRRIVQANNLEYLISPNGAPPLGGRLWGLVRLNVRDELTGGPPASIIRIEAKERGMIPKISSDGVVGLVGIPQQVFPNLKVAGYNVHLTVKADGYVAHQVEVPVGANPLFPAAFTPPAPVTVLLHREPTVIKGRTIRLNGATTTPLGGATVEVTGIWRTPPPADVIVAADPPNLVSLRPPLYAGRPSLTGHLQSRNLPMILGDDKQLLEHVSPGAASIKLSNRQNLVLGDILFVDALQPDIAEYIAINTITGASTPDQPASFTLDQAGVYEHQRNTTVQRVSPQPLGAVKQFTVVAIAGDTCIFLDDVSGLAAANEVRISGGVGLKDEYHSLKRFSVISDADGYYRLPPLSRVAQVKIHAERVVGPQTFKAELEFRPDYEQRENRLDLTLTV